MNLERRDDHRQKRCSHRQDEHSALTRPFCSILQAESELIDYLHLYIYTRTVMKMLHFYFILFANKIVNVT